MRQNYTSREICDLIEGKLMRTYGREPRNATDQQMYKVTCQVVRDIMSELWLTSNDLADIEKKKQVYYLSMEFLPGPSLKNNVFNLKLDHIIENALANFGRDIHEFYAMDPDAGLGNGGLGRLASCYLDAMATRGLSGHGMSICYEYGIFKQKLEHGNQIEVADDWLNLGDVWIIPKEDEAEEVYFGGKLEEIWQGGKMQLVHKDYTTVLAIPNDMLITGYDSETVNSLRLWKSTSPIEIDMKLFAEGKYLKSMEQKQMAEVISKILYPEDAHSEGKSLRIKQQYFFISASMQTITKKHFKKYGAFENFPDKVSIHVNDTHPTLAIPELMRLLMDVYDYEWEAAWKIVTKTISYTNHTVMPEALERWPQDLFAELLPRIYSIVAEINRRNDLWLVMEYPEEESLRRQMAIIAEGQIRMANLCVAAAHQVNGVSALHSKIIQKQLFHGYYKKNPEKFTNVTNGIAYRRWLCQANPKLSDFIEDLIGPGFKSDASKLEGLLQYKDDPVVLERLDSIKRFNKKKLAAYMKDQSGILVNPDSIFDVQVKRLHEYKRQLLNIFHIIHLYNLIKDDPEIDLQPRTFLFGAKAAAGYYMAKQIIRLAYEISLMIDKDPDVKGRIKVVFLENYSVSLSELIMPAADVSEQISLAGKEASGTGNMKLMINGAVTIGTLDGANVEIHQAVGDDNIFLFGMRAEEVEKVVAAGNYSPWSFAHKDYNIQRIIDRLATGINGVFFGDILNSVTTGYNGNADQYFVLADFDYYRVAQSNLADVWTDRNRWNKMSLTNIAKAGIFSADRAVMDYAQRIWRL